jgi:hypothetical protein
MNQDGESATVSDCKTEIERVSAEGLREEEEEDKEKSRRKHGQ